MDKDTHKVSDEVRVRLAAVANAFRSMGISFASGAEATQKLALEMALVRFVQVTHSFPPEVVGKLREEVKRRHAFSQELAATLPSKGMTMAEAYESVTDDLRKSRL